MVKWYSRQKVKTCYGDSSVNPFKPIRQKYSFLPLFFFAIEWKYSDVKFSRGRSLMTSVNLDFWTPSPLSVIKFVWKKWKIVSTATPLNGGRHKWTVPNCRDLNFPSLDVFITVVQKTTWNVFFPSTTRIYVKRANFNLIFVILKIEFRHFASLAEMLWSL